jgi:hypothetical protein
MEADSAAASSSAADALPEPGRMGQRRGQAIGVVRKSGFEGGGTVGGRRSIARS